jgi:hypothetical protein
MTEIQEIIQSSKDLTGGLKQEIKRLRVDIFDLKCDLSYTETRNLIQSTRNQIQIDRVEGSED